MPIATELKMSDVNTRPGWHISISWPNMHGYVGFLYLIPTVQFWPWDISLLATSSVRTVYLATLYLVWLWFRVGISVIRIKDTQEA